MADPPLSRARPLVVLLAAGLALPAPGCAGGAGGAAARSGASTVAAEPRVPEESGAWVRMRSDRLHLSFPLPDGDGWRLQDGRDGGDGEVRAEHAATGSRFALRVVHTTELMNHDRCEARAREVGFVPPRDLRTVETALVAQPRDFDTKVWIAVEPGATDAAAVTGYAFAFGASLRRCLLVRYETQVPSAAQDGALSSRLALFRTRVMPEIRLDALESTPREAPALGRRPR